MYLCLSGCLSMGTNSPNATTGYASEVVSSHIPLAYPHAYSFASRPSLARSLPLRHRLHIPTK